VAGGGARSGDCRSVRLGGRRGLAGQHVLDVRKRAVGHFLVEGRDDAALDFLVQLLAEDTQRPRGSDDGERVKIIAQRADLQFVGGILDPAILVLLVEIRFAQGGAPEAKLCFDEPAASVLISCPSGLPLVMPSVRKSS
jgi:hypothetical protein